MFLKLSVEARQTRNVGCWNSAGGTHLETKSGSYIYYGDAASFHDWEFRTCLRTRLWKKNNKPKANSWKSAPSSSPSSNKKQEMPNGGTEDDADLPGFPAVKPEDEDEVVLTKPGISTLVNKILEGLRGGALFFLAKGRRS